MPAKTTKKRPSGFLFTGTLLKINPKPGEHHLESFVNVRAKMEYSPKYGSLYTIKGRKYQGF